MKTTPCAFRLSCLVAGLALLAPALQASVRFSTGNNLPTTQTTYATSTGWSLPNGDWTIGIWDNNFQGNGGILISGPIKLAYVKLSSSNLAKEGRFVVGGTDSAGNFFGSGGSTMQGSIVGMLPNGYPGRPTGKFMPRLHIIRRNAGKSEYLVAEAGHAPVLVSSEERPFTGTTGRVSWALGSINGSEDPYDSDLEGFFFATVSVSEADIGLMAAGAKPTSLPSLNGNLPVYYPLETAQLSSTANPLTLTNLGSDTVVGFQRTGSASSYRDGPMLRGATTENNTPAQVTEPTNVVSLNSFQPFQIIRHLNGSADVHFRGVDQGVGTADIEIRFIHPEKGTTTPWQTLMTNSPGGGAAIQPTTSVPKGYWKTLEVRRVNSVGGVGDSNRPVRTWSRWAVGEVVQVWGDSIQGQIHSTGRANIVAANGFTAKYPSTMATPNTIPGDSNPLSHGMWNLLRAGGMGGGAQGENEIANKLSDASQCCVGITVSWAGATTLKSWTVAGSSNYEKAKAYCLANDGLNKPSVITWVGNLASANAFDDFYTDLTNFKANLDRDFGAGTWKLIVAPVPVMYDRSGGSALSFQTHREAGWRWVRDNPDVALYAGISIDHLTYDGVHPVGDAWNLMGPRWGNAAGYLRDQQNYADPRAGEVVNFYRSGNDLIVKVQLYAGTALSLKNPAVGITGFTLSSDNFATAIPLSAALINGTTVRITPTGTLPGGALKLRYLYGKPGVSGSTLADQGLDNILYVNAGPTNILAIQPIWGTSANGWSLSESAPPPPPSITPGALPSGTVGSAYSRTLAATGGMEPYIWSVSSGSLPAGLTLNGAGVISGTPTTAGGSTFSVAATGADGLTSPPVSFTLAISAAATYSNWQDSRFTPEELAAGVAAPAADADQDGLANLLEYAFGGDPKASDSATVAPVAVLAGAKLALSFPCDAERTDITYTVQSAPGLDAASWVDIAESVGGGSTHSIGSLSQVIDSGAGRRVVTVTDSTSLSGAGGRFLRLKITRL